MDSLLTATTYVKTAKAEKPKPKKKQVQKQKPTIEFSGRALVSLLRHIIFSEMLSSGYVPCKSLKECFKNVVTDEMLLDCVIREASGDKGAKQRLSMCTIDSILHIRANQGHSEKVAARLVPSLIYERIETSLSEVFHGTTRPNLRRILSSGLNKMARGAIHCATSPDARSGARKSSDVRIYINMQEAMADGIEFFMSENGVVLTTGVNGILDPKYFGDIVLLTL